MATTDDLTAATTFGKCEHPACNCMVPQGKQFCSAVCEKPSPLPMVAHGQCPCGHAACDNE